MAACSFGASTVKFSDLSLRLSGSKLGTLQPPCSMTTRTRVNYGSLMVTRRLGKELIECKCLSNEEQAAANSESESEEAKCSGTTSPRIPNSYEVESLLTQICDTTSIAEFELKFGGFMLNVRRNLAEESTPSFPPVSASVNMNTKGEARDVNGSVTTTLAISKPVPPSGGIQTLLDNAADEGLMIIQSRRVGYFRRSRTINGKRAPPPCEEKQIVKEGQVLCYIQQLGCEIPVESDTSGEVIKILREDGEPVGYGDALIAILPSFPGIKLQ